MDAHDFVTISLRRMITPISAGPPQGLLRSFLNDYVEALSEAGCTMVGHIKGILEGGDSPTLFFSVTSLEGEPQLKGGPLREGNDLSLSITTIASGMNTENLSHILEDSLERYFLSVPGGG